MEQNIKPITKQLVIAAFILISVTVLSFGIRQIRLSAHRANTIVADTEDQLQPEQSLNADVEPNHYPADSLTVDAEPDPQYANASDFDEQAPSDDNSESHTDSVKQNKAVSEAKSFKGDYAKAEGKKGLQKISLGDFEDLYRTGEGELWYVSEQPDGPGAKVQLEEDITGEINIVDIVDSGENK